MKHAMMTQIDGPMKKLRPPNRLAIRPPHILIYCTMPSRPSLLFNSIHSCSRLHGSDLHVLIINGLSLADFSIFCGTFLIRQITYVYISRVHKICVVEEKPTSTWISVAFTSIYQQTNPPLFARSTSQPAKK
jgi:hypothetical protein